MNCQKNYSLTTLNATNSKSGMGAGIIHGTSKSLAAALFSVLLPSLVCNARATETRRKKLKRNSNYLGVIRINSELNLRYF